MLLDFVARKAVSEDETDVMNSFLKEYHEVLILLPAELFPQTSKHGKHSFTRLPLGPLNFCCMRCYCDCCCMGLACGAQDRQQQGPR